MNANMLLQRRSIELVHADSYMSASPVRIVATSLSPSSTNAAPHTDDLKCNDNPLVTRRGCSIILQITLSCSISCPYTVAMTFIPVHGPRERSSLFKASGSAIKGGRNVLWLSIDLPTTFPIGYYDTLVSVTLQGCVEVITHSMHSALVVLFNPWSPDDDTYIEAENERQLYCLNDTGTIWRGTVSDPIPRLWIFGQFEPECLDTALILMKDLSADDRRTPYSVVRAILSKIMPKDNSGIILSSYNGLYGGGTPPCRWNGSAPIIQKYYRTRSSVKFGQCWVACGIAVSLLRSLGVPCRTVTCYEAAIPSINGKSTKTLMQFHRYFTPEGDPVFELETDKIWSYRTLCECWMRRSDLSIKYDGWQVADISAQRCIGPIPVVALKERQPKTLFGNNISVLLAMINAEIHYHRVNHSYATMSNRQCSLAKVMQNQCGQMIITTDPNDTSRYINITAEYKTISTIAPPHSELATYPYPPPSKDCSIQVACGHGDVCNDFTITITLTNSGPMVRTVDGRVVVITNQYNGDHPKSLLFTEFSGKITPKRDAIVDVRISGKECVKHSSDQNVLRLFILAKTRETQQLFIINRYHIIHQPKLSVIIKNQQEVIRVGDDIRVCVSFKNIMTSSLSHAVITLEEIGYHKELSYRRVILPGRVVSVEFPLRITRTGTHVLIANMYSDKLQNVMGSNILTI